MRFSPDIRAFFRKLWKDDKTVSETAGFFGTSRRTVYRWIRRGSHAGREHYRDKPRRPRESRITLKAELSIVAMRNTFRWERQEYSRACNHFQTASKSPSPLLFRE